MTRRVYLYFAVTFLLGIILGGAGVYYYGWSTGHWHHPPFNRVRAVAHLKKALALSESQVQQVNRIFDESSQKVKDLQKQVDPQFQALRQETCASVRQILNAEQAKKFDELVRQADARHNRHPSPPPPPSQ